MKIRSLFTSGSGLKEIAIHHILTVITQITYMYDDPYANRCNVRLR